jgi:hypothetical protein
MTKTRNALIFAGSVILTFGSFGCATLTPAGKLVKIVDPVQLNDVKDCKELEAISESSENQYAGEKIATLHLKNKAAELGANVIVSKLKAEKTIGILSAAYVVKGKAFNCPDSVLKNLHSAEDF